MLQIKIYLDIIFFINFICDFFVLLLTGIILKQKIVFWRIIIGAAFGSGMLLPLLISPYMLVKKTGIFVFLGISMGAVFISYGRNGGIIKKWFLSTTIMILLGGMMNFIRNTMGITSVKFVIWLGLFIGSGTLSFFIMTILKNILRKENYKYLIKIKNNEKLVFDFVYLDTGNMLRDPIFGKPIILLSEELVKKCMTEDEIIVLNDYKKDGFINYEKVARKKNQRKDYFHEIAYQSVGNPSGKLLCFLVEEIWITDLKKELKKQPIAIAPSELFAGKEYQGLLHRDCI